MNLQDKKALPFDFWNDHSRRFFEMAFDVERRGRMENVDGHGVKTGDCGDSVEFSLALADWRKKELSGTI